MKLLICLLLSAVVVACNANESTEAANAKPLEPGDRKTLGKAFENLVEVAKRGEEAKVLEALEGFLATRETLVGFFGDALGARVWSGYSDKIAPKFRADAAKIIIDQVQKRGLTAVTVEQVGPAYPQNTTPGDQKMLDAMRKKRPMFTVRLHKPDEKIGLRLNGFVYDGQRWRALLKSYDHMAPPKDAAPPPPPPVDAAPAAPADAGAQ